MIRVGRKARYWRKSHSKYIFVSVTEELSDGTLRLPGKKDAHIPRDQVQLVPEGVLQSKNGPDEPALGGNEDACVGPGGGSPPAVGGGGQQDGVGEKVVHPSMDMIKKGLVVWASPPGGKDADVVGDELYCVVSIGPRGQRGGPRGSGLVCHRRFVPHQSIHPAEAIR